MNISKFKIASADHIGIERTLFRTRIRRSEECPGQSGRNCSRRMSGTTVNRNGKSGSIPASLRNSMPVKAMRHRVRSSSVYADAAPISTHGTVRLWRLGSGVDSNTAVRALSSASQPGTYSPVLHDGPTTAGGMRALPGNIIVYLDPAWDDAAVNAWASKHQLEIIKKLEIGPNIYLIKTAPGLEALNTANALYKSGEVVAAFPDWWKQVTTR